MAVRRKRFAQRRRALGYTQESLATRLRVDRTTVVRWERGDCEPQPWIRQRLAATLDVSLAQLDALLANSVVELDTDPVSVVTVETGIDTGGDVVDRRAFAINTALVGLGVAAPFRGLFTSVDVPPLLGMDELRVATGLIDRFEQADAVLGGDAFCDFAIGLRHRLLRWQRECDYSREVGAGLETALGKLESWIGWLTLDAERRTESRAYLQEVIVRARLNDDPQLEVQGMCTLSMLLRDVRPQEALHCAEAAQRIAAGWATPRLSTLLHLRCAAANALMGDAAAFRRQMAKAKAHFDRGAHPDDPQWIQFVTPLEMSGIEGLCLMALDRPDRAAATYARGLDDGETVYRRNSAIHTVQLAEALHAQGDVTGASEVAIKALPAVTALRSSRTQQRFDRLRTNLGKSAKRVRRAREFTEAYDQAMAGVDRAQ